MMAGFHGERVIDQEATLYGCMIVNLIASRIYITLVEHLLIKKYKKKKTHVVLLFGNGSDPPDDLWDKDLAIGQQIVGCNTGFYFV